MRSRTNLRDAILDAAENVMMEAGAVTLSLDAVAAEAGVSKGGLLYHFRTKQALLQALVERLIEEHENIRLEAWKRLPETPGRELKAHILAWNSRHGAGYKTGQRRIHAALVTVLADNPSIMEPLRRKYRQLFEHFIAAGVSFGRAAVVSLAVDGIMLMEILGAWPFEEEERRQIMEELFHLAEGADSDTQDVFPAGPAEHGIS